MKSAFTFQVVDRNTENYLDKIGKEELALLIDMLESIGSTVIATAKQSYGYNPDAADGVYWNEEQLEKYKTTTLKNRIENQGYTFFKLVDENGKVVALASGDMNNPAASWEKQREQAQKLGVEAGKESGNYFRLLNVVVTPELRRTKPGTGNGIGVELLEHINNVLVHRNVTLLQGPVSEQGREKGLDSFYKAALAKAGYKAEEFTVEIDGANQSVFTARNPRLVEITRTQEAGAASFVERVNPPNSPIKTRETTPTSAMVEGFAAMVVTRKNADVGTSRGGQ